MSYLFDNEAYPIVTSEADIIEAFSVPMTRAVILRDEETWQRESEVFKSGIIMQDNPALGAQYRHDPSAKNDRKIAGEISYLDVISASEVLAEAQKADIILDPAACTLFHDKMNALRGLYARVHDAYFGAKDDETIVGHAMFTPKHGVGRSPMMHVDDVRMTLHTTFAGATLRLLNGLTTDTLWDLMDKTKSGTLAQGQRSANDMTLSHLTEQYSEEFSSARLGDVILMKGQKNMDLQDPDIRDSMGVHTSSPFVSYQGQAAAILYSKKTLDIE